MGLQHELRIRDLSAEGARADGSAALYSVMRRLMYIPGIWSLGLLLPLCVWYLYRQGVWEQERCITMAFPIPPEFREDYDYPLPPAPREVRLDWTEFACESDHSTIEATFLAFRDSLRDMESKGDTIRGIHVHFGPKTSYATIISAIDICRTTVIAWELDDHDLWALHYPETRPDKVKKADDTALIDCGGVCCGTRPPADQSMMKATLLRTTAVMASVHWMIWVLLGCIGILGLRTAFRAANPLWRQRKSPRLVRGLPFS